MLITHKQTANEIIGVRNNQDGEQKKTETGKQGKFTSGHDPPEDNYYL